MTNPREQAIEKLEYIIRNYPYKVSDVNAGRGWHYRHIEVILDALNIEVVSKESDIVMTYCCPECEYPDYDKGIWRKGNKERICRNCGQSWFADIQYKKPQVYVENIGVKL